MICLILIYFQVFVKNFEAALAHRYPPEAAPVTRLCNILWDATKDEKKPKKAKKINKTASSPLFPNNTMHTKGMHWHWHWVWFDVFKREKNQHWISIQYQCCKNFSIELNFKFNSMFHVLNVNINAYFLLFQYFQCLIVNFFNICVSF